MELHAYLEKHQRRLTRRLEEMVRIPTVNPPGERYLQMVDRLERYCRELDLQVAMHRVPDKAVARVGADPGYPRYLLVARWRVGAARTVHFNAHYDVVPAAGRWRSGDPYVPLHRNGRVYGRGTGDMKGAIAALLMAVEGLQRTGGQPAFDVECSFTPDEETGGQLGAGYLVEQGLVRADGVVVCEGGSGARVGCGHNGVLWLQVRLEGKAAHAASPEEGSNAFAGMADLAVHLGGLQRALGAPERRYRDLDGRERSPTLSLGGVFGGGAGDKVNTVPAVARFSIDRRVLPGETLAQAEKELRRAIDHWAGRQARLRCRVEVPLRIDPCRVDPQGALPQAFARAVRAVRRCPVAFRVARGFTDLHYFIADGGLPGIGYGVRGERAHGADERVDVRDLLQTCRTYAEFMRQGLQES